MPDPTIHERSTSTADHRFQRILGTTILVSALVSGVVGGGLGVFGGLSVANGGWPTWNQIGRLLTTGTWSNVQGAQTPLDREVTVQESSATIDAVEKVSPSVVSVILTQDLSKLKTEQNPFNDPFFFSPFFQQEPQQQEGKQDISAGTGFLVSADGLILTNKHVVEKAVDNPDIDLTVLFNDGSEHTAKVIGADPFNDLAIIKIDGKDLPVAELGDSDALKLGQTVIAIGNALGQYTNTVTSGVVSGKNRTVQAGDRTGKLETIDEAIQTDAAINHGNSGGPLINLAGQVVGVNTAISEEGRLIGFAIPISAARQVIESVKKTGSIQRAYLGVRHVLVNKALQEQNNLPVDYGALLQRGESASELAVIPGSPADKAGLEENDILLEFNGEKITEDKPVTSFMRTVKIGDSVTLKVLHDGSEQALTVTLEAYKAPKQESQ